MAKSFKNTDENIKRVASVRAWITKRGITKKFLCVQVGIPHQSYLSAMIGNNPTRRMPPHTFHKIANFFKN